METPACTEEEVDEVVGGAEAGASITEEATAKEVKAHCRHRAGNKDSRHEY